MSDRSAETVANPMLLRMLNILDRELTIADLDSLPDRERRKLASLLHHWARLAEANGNG